MVFPDLDFRFPTIFPNESLMKRLASYLIIAVLAFIIFSGLGCQAQQSDNSFYFVQITDTHWPEDANFVRTRKIVNAVNKLPMKIEFVVLTGDITMEKTDDTYIVDKGKAILGRLKMPVYYVPGNHDIYADKSSDTKKLYEQAFGEINQQAEYQGVVFLFVDTLPFADTDFNSRSSAAFEWIESHLKKAQNKPVVIFLHIPSVLDFYNNKFHESWPEDKQDRWIKLLNKYRVKAVIAGHFHRDEHHWLGDVPLYVCTPVVGYWGRQATYRIYEYKNGRLGYRTKYIE